MKILDVPQSGSLAGQTSSRNRFGQYRRTRAIPVNPNSITQTAARSALSDFSAGWRGLSEADRLGWIALADSVTLSNSLGQSINLTGHQMFVRCNTALVRAGLDPLTAAPVEPTFNPQGAVTVVSDASSHILTVTAADMTAASDGVVVEASPQRSQGRYFEGDYRFVQFVTPGTAFNAGQSVVTAYEARFGSLISGSVVFLRLRQLKDGFYDVGTTVRVAIVP